METPWGELPERFVADMSMAEMHDYLSVRGRRLSRRRFLQTGGLAAGLVAAGPVLWRRSARAADVPVLHRRLAYGSDPTTSMTVSWSTPVPVVNPSIDIGAEEVLADTTPSPSGHPTQYHHATVENLDPGATLTATILHDGTASGTVDFATAPIAGGPFTFATLGDMGVSAGAAANIAGIAASGAELVFFVGDLCYAYRTGGVTAGLPPLDAALIDEAIWDQWLAQVEPSTSAIPWMTGVGNHEMEPGFGPQGYDGYHARMRMPADLSSGTRSAYSFTYRNVGFVHLDANDVSFEITPNTGYSGGMQTAWLDTTLSGLRADPSVDFIVVGFHHCAHCTNLVHGSDQGVRDWGPLFDSYGVDLVVNGHNHSYERTHPVRGGDIVDDPSEKGTVYVTAGGGGQAPYPTSLAPAATLTIEGGVRIPEVADWSAVRYLDHSYVLVDVDPSAPTMTVTAFAADGATVVDRFAIGAHSRPDAPAVEVLGDAGRTAGRGVRDLLPDTPPLV